MNHLWMIQGVFSSKERKLFSEQEQALLARICEEEGIDHLNRLVVPVLTLKEHVGDPRPLLLQMWAATKLLDSARQEHDSFRVAATDDR